MRIARPVVVANLGKGLCLAVDDVGWRDRERKRERQRKREMRIAWNLIDKS